MEGIHALDEIHCMQGYHKNYLSQNNNESQHSFFIYTFRSIEMKEKNYTRFYKKLLSDFSRFYTKKFVLLSSRTLIYQNYISE